MDEVRQCSLFSRKKSKHQRCKLPMNEELHLHYVDGIRNDILWLKGRRPKSTQGTENMLNISFS